MLIEGEPGIGKSRVLEACGELARDAGCTLLTASASALEADRPFGVVGDLFSGHVGSVLDGWLRGDGSVEEWPAWVTQTPELRYRIIDAAIELFERLSQERPVLVAVDDLQWVDSSSGLYLHGLVRRIRSIPALAVLTTRPPAEGSSVELLVESLVRDGSTHLRLGPLAPDCVYGMATELLGAPPGPKLRHKLDRAAGNPLYVSAIVDSLKRQGGTADAPDVTDPESLRLTVLRSLRFLDLATRQGLRQASVLGETFALGDLGLVMGCPALEAWAKVSPAREAGLLREAGEGLCFRHELVRDAVYSEMPRSVRAHMHAQAARALAAAGRDPMTVAGQVTLGPSEADPWGADQLRQAAKAAAAQNPDAAVSWLERAAELTPEGAPGRYELLADLVMTLLWAGRVDEAVSLATDLLARSPGPALAASVRLGLGWALFAAGRTNEAAEVFVLGARDRALAASDRSRLAGFASWTVGAQLGQFARARELALEAVEGAEASGDDLGLCLGKTTLAGLSYFEGRLTSAVEQSAWLAQTFGTHADVEIERVPHHILLGLSLVDADRLDEGDRALDEGRRISERVGAVWNLTMWHWAYAIRHFAAGDWDDALAEVEAGLALAVDTGANFGSIVGQAVRALIAVHRNDLRTAGEAVGAALTALRTTGSEYRAGWALWAEALLLEAQGDAPRAFEALSGVWALCRELGLTVELPWLGPDVVRISLACGDRALAESVAEAVDACPDRDVVPSIGGAALRCRGLAEQSPDLLLAAVDRYRRGPRRHGLAETLVDAGAALAESGRADEARTALYEAGGLLDEIGAEAGAARADSMLRALGVRRTRPGPRRRAAGWAGLTPSEARVAALVAGGLTNADIAARLFVSRRTVESHVAHILVKLGVSSRMQVAIFHPDRRAEGPRNG